MKSRSFHWAFISLMIISFLFIPITITSCSQTSENDTEGEAITSMKIGVLPLVSALPIFVAEGNGYFAEENLDIELLSFNSALEQDAALQAGEIDGYFNDPINAITMINGGVDISIINSPYIANEENRMFAIMVSAESSIENVAELKGVEIGIAHATNIEYMQEKILEHYGFAEDEIASQEIKQIPIRLQLLLSGELESALLPETLVSLAELQGARAVADDTVLDFSETVIALDNSLMAQDPTLKERFLNACAKATRQINTDPESCNEIFFTSCNIAEVLQGRYQIPYFVENYVPSEEEIDEIQLWLVKKGVIDEKLPYDRIVK
jgi:NitT/TauT family transport system substrate-binding protein